MLGLTCYHTKEGDSHNSVYFGAFHEAKLMEHCAVCMKTTIIQNQPGLYYQYVQYQCLEEGITNMVAEFCQPQIQITAYPDGSMFRKSCSCCRDNCNDETFCTEQDPTVQRVVGNFSAQAVNMHCNAISINHMNSTPFFIVTALSLFFTVAFR